MVFEMLLVIYVIKTNYLSLNLLFNCENERKFENKQHLTKLVKNVRKKHLTGFNRTYLKGDIKYEWETHTPRVSEGSRQA